MRQILTTCAWASSSREASCASSTWGGQRPTVLIQATHAGQGIGQCLVRSAGEYSRASAVQDWAFVDWLGVREPHQGIGLGKHLLQRGLNEMRGVGYRHASISTAWDNYRAYVLYTHFGFRVVDWTYGYRQEIARCALLSRSRAGVPPGCGGATESNPSDL